MLTRAVDRLYASPFLLLSLTALFWGGNAVSGQLAVGNVLPMQLVQLRWLLVGGALWLLYGAEVRAIWPQIRPRFGRLLAMALVGFTAFNALFYLAAYRTPAVNVGIIQGSIPVFVLLGARAMYGTRVRPMQIAGVALTLIGVVVVATRGAPWSILDLGVNPGDAVMLVACSLYAAYTVLLPDRPAISGTAFFTVMAMLSAVTSLPLVIGEALVAGPQLPTLKGWLVTLYVAIFPSCLSQLFFMRGVDLIGPGRAGVFVNLVPIFSALLAVMLLGESFQGFHAVALCLVIGGIVLAQRGGQR